MSELHTGTPNPALAHDDESVYDALLVNDAHWAFGTDFADPLRDLDDPVPDGVDAEVLGRYLLALGDDALVASHRLGQWSSRAPDLEEDIALSNIALDLLGQARVCLGRASVVAPGLVPQLPAGSPAPGEDRLAYFRGAEDFRNVRLVELVNGDFADAVLRVLLLAAWRFELFTRLSGSRDPVLAALAAKGVKELAYHRDFAARWVVVLGGGTAESQRRLGEAYGRLWGVFGELFVDHDVDRAAAEQGVGVRPSELAGPVIAALAPVLERAGLEVSEPAAPAGFGGRTGRDGVHSEALGPMLAEMQVVAREHPLGRW